MRKAQRTVVIVAPHFPPSNLAGVHRARLLSQHLHEFGWHPIILTAHWRHYEESLDWDLTSLIDPALEIIQTQAIPAKPVRIIGDIGLRALPWHLAALRKLRREGRMDFLLITVPSFYSAVLGGLLHRAKPLPFGIDYIDPWVHLWPPAEIKFSKAWASLKLGRLLEPWAVRHAALITGVAEGYYGGVLQRNPHLKDRCVTAGMPYGFSTRDFDAPAVAEKRPYLFNPSDGNIHVVYAGALLPKAGEVLDRFLEGLALLRQRDLTHTDRVRVHFIGTGKSPTDANGFNVLPAARRAGVADLVTEHPHRMAYLDVLTHLKRAYGVLIVGSTEPHYTPSKVYQAVQSRRPVFALLHRASTAVDVLEHSRAGVAVTLTEDVLPGPQCIADSFERFLDLPYEPEAVRWDVFAAYSARESARKMAQAMDEAIDGFRHRAGTG
jgi:hypothetical protein